MSVANTIEFTLGELKTIESSLKKLLELQLPIKIAYRFSKALAKISKELALLNEQHSNLVRKYGINNEETQEIRVSPENMEAFVAEFNELISEKIEVSMAPISIDSLPDSLNITPFDMANLEKFFE
jgi:hypothetical protein